MKKIEIKSFDINFNIFNIILIYPKCVLGWLRLPTIKLQSQLAFVNYKLNNNHRQNKKKMKNEINGNLGIL